MTAKIAALFIDPKGPYVDRPNIDTWDEIRDARNYRGPYPVVAHPPCQSWSKLAPLRELRYGYPVGIDGGCFASALQSVHRWGGILEHPADSKAWETYSLTRPVHGDWMPARDATGRIYWVTETWQVDYGHRAKKRTWLIYVGKTRPSPMRFEKKAHTACVSGLRNRTRRITGKHNRVWSTEAKRTPPDFADALVELARNCGGAP